MEDFLKQVPGFRSNIIWKKIVAGLFYFVFIFATLSKGLEGLLIFGGAILLGISIIDLVRNKKGDISFKTPILLLLAGIILLSSGSHISSNNAIASKETEKLQLITGENEELKIEISTLKEDKEKLKSKNLELTKENDQFLAEEKKKKDEVDRLAKEQKEEEEAKLAEEQKKEEAKLAEEHKKEEEAQKQKQAKEQEEKETLAAKSQETAKSNNSTNNNSSNSSSNQGVAKSAPSQAAAENTAEVLVTPTGKKYHKRVCGNGNYSPSTLSAAKARGLTPCKKCF